MKITKFVHSCLLVEDVKNILIDPGVYSQEALNVSALPKLDYLLITHEHPDHMHVPLIKEVLAKFPDLKIFSNAAVADLLQKEGISVEISGNDDIETDYVPHEKVFGSEPPSNILFNVLRKLTHPGDSFHFTSRNPILALPVQAPWGSLTEAVSKAEEIRPQVILPIHDWHWRDEARVALYKRLEDYFGNLGIKFISLETGKAVEI